MVSQLTRVLDLLSSRVSYFFAFVQVLSFLAREGHRTELDKFARPWTHLVLRLVARSQDSRGTLFGFIDVFAILGVWGRSRLNGPP